MGLRKALLLGMFVYSSTLSGDCVCSYEFSHTLFILLYLYMVKVARAIKRCSLSEHPEE